MSFVSLAVVCLVAVVVLRWLGRKGIGRSDDCIRIVGRCFLEPRRCVYLIEAGDRCFLVGVGDGPMSLLAEIDRAAVPPAPAPGETPVSAFGDVLGKLLRRRGQ